MGKKFKEENLPDIQKEAVTQHYNEMSLKPQMLAPICGGAGLILGLVIGAVIGTKCCGKKAVEPTRSHNDYHLSLQTEPRGSPRTTSPFMSKPEGTYTVRDNEAY